MGNPVGPKISALVMIYNEAGQIRECLDTVKWVDEIVVCDSFSTDGTVDICREYTDKIYQRKFDNFGNQKRWILTKPTCEWVLFVEADERFPEELAEEIRRRIASDEGYGGYRMRFKNYFLGKELKGRFWAFSKVKLFKNGKGGWEDKLVHVNFVLNGKAGDMENAVLHYPYRSMGVFLQKLNRFTDLEAEELMRMRKNVCWYDSFRALAWVPTRFIKYYFVWGDYKSGLPGFIISVLSSPYPFIVNIKYWAKKLGYILGKKR